ncbi:hypothetical protein BWK60_12765 [Flavobacterium covae]|uniref:hypothetical protein n=1 Tax=Flavobacterium covae TaxID=2906076 RepID=UPI000B4D79C4|nr:hypothetical protein [Flavobacterium covae]OWP85689.1 hypothetical protein BWK60_12765 [Flavobacterium covae]
MEKETPYEYHDNKLGVKLKYLIADRNKHEDSLCLFTYRALRQRLDRFSSQEEELRRGCYGKDALVVFESLDRRTKDILILTFGEPEKEVKKNWFASAYMPDSYARQFFEKHTYGEDNKKLKSKDIDLYTNNASVLNTVIKIKEQRKYGNKARQVQGVDIWETLSNDVNAFREITHNLPTSSHGLRRKIREYQKNGYASLISGKLTTKNAIKVKSREQMALLDELISKHNNFENQTISEIYNALAERLEWKLITAQTVGNRRKLSNLTTYAGRKGTKALSNNILMQNKRSKPTKPMLYWTLDGWMAELLYQKTTVDNKGYSTTTYHNRLTIVVVLDPFNKYPVGYAIGQQESSELIKEAMLNAVMHTKELFGQYFKPVQLQSDNYQMKKLKPMYEACTKYFTPAKVGNAKAKVIEPYFAHINKKYCQMFENWSGFGVESGSKKQPNDEYLNKIRHSFPDEAGCRMQLESIISAERSKKQKEYLQQWNAVEDELRLPFEKESFLMALGSTTGGTNRLTGEGIRLKINGSPVFYDCFDMSMRKKAHLDWKILYNPHNLEEAIALSPEGDYRFELEQKYIQPMALAEQSENDTAQRLRIKEFNEKTTTYIIEKRQENIETLKSVFENPLLNDTLAKHLLVDSRGQHKDTQNKEKMLQVKAEKVMLKQEKEKAKKEEKTWLEEQNEYIKEKIDLTKYAQY